MEVQIRFPLRLLFLATILPLEATFIPFSPFHLLFNKSWAQERCHYGGIALQSSPSPMSSRSKQFHSSRWKCYTYFQCMPLNVQRVHGQRMLPQNHPLLTRMILGEYHGSRGHVWVASAGNHPWLDCAVTISWRGCC
jgi:hypothetical protein